MGRIEPRNPAQKISSLPTRPPVVAGQNCFFRVLYKVCFMFRVSYFIPNPGRVTCFTFHFYREDKPRYVFLVFVVSCFMFLAFALLSCVSCFWSFWTFHAPYLPPLPPFGPCFMFRVLSTRPPLILVLVSGFGFFHLSGCYLDKRPSLSPSQMIAWLSEQLQNIYPLQL